MSVQVISAKSDEIQRLRALRLGALKDAPYAFGAKYEDELLKNDDEWLRRLKVTTWCFVTKDEVDIGLLALDSAEADRNSDCWVSSWWIEEKYRGQGIAKLMLNWISQQCQKNNWKKIGLGVWPENKLAITAYERLGFISADSLLPSRSKPGQMYQVMYKNIGDI